MKKLIKDDEFVNSMKDLELCAWTSFADEVKNFLDKHWNENHKCDNTHRPPRSNALGCTFVCNSFATVLCIVGADRPVRNVAAKSAQVVDILSRSGGVFTCQTKTIKTTEGRKKEDKNNELETAKPQ